MLTPKVRFALRAIIMGLVAAGTSIQSHLPGISGNDVLDAALAFFIIAGGYAGVGLATPLEPSAGVGSTPASDKPIN